MQLVIMSIPIKTNKWVQVLNTKLIDISLILVIKHGSGGRVRKTEKERGCRGFLALSECE